MRSNNLAPKMLRAILVLLGFSTFLFVACNEDNGIIGIDVIPPGDQIEVGFDSSTGLVSHSVYSDSIRSDEDILSQSRNYSLLGSYIDPVFGNTRADFITQVRLSQNLVDFGDDFVIDSLVLFLELEDLYGDTRQTGSQDIFVYQLIDTISKDEIYYSNMNLDNYYDPNEVLAHKTITPSYGDSIISINLDYTPFIDVFSDTLNMVDNESLFKVFKGLYVTSDPVGYLGSVMSISMISEFTRLRLYYHKYPESYPLVPANTGSHFDFLINEFCARVNLFYHDYESAINPIQHLNDSLVEDSIIYVQGMGGVKVKIDLLGIENWRDSVGIVISNANLIIPIVENSTDIFSPLPLLTLAYINDDGENEFFPDLYHNGSYFHDYFNGRYNAELKAYEFNIAMYIQSLIDGNLSMNGFYLYPYSTESPVTANRVILKGAKATDGMRINITYMKL